MEPYPSTPVPDLSRLSGRERRRVEKMGVLTRRPQLAAINVWARTAVQWRTGAMAIGLAQLYLNVAGIIGLIAVLGLATLISRPFLRKASAPLDLWMPGGVLAVDGEYLTLASATFWLGRPRKVLNTWPLAEVSLGSVKRGWPTTDNVVLNLPGGQSPTIIVTTLGNRLETLGRIQAALEQGSSRRPAVAPPSDPARPETPPFEGQPTE